MVELTLSVCPPFSLHDLAESQQSKLSSKRHILDLTLRTRIITTLFFRKKFKQGSKDNLQFKGFSDNPKIRRSVRELAFDIESLRKDVELFYREVVPQVKKISAFITIYNDLVVERIRIIMGYYEDMTLICALTKCKELGSRQFGNYGFAHGHRGLE